MDERTGMGWWRKVVRKWGWRVSESEEGRGCEGGVYRLRGSDEKEKGCERAGLEEEKGCERAGLEEEKGV